MISDQIFLLDGIFPPPSPEWGPVDFYWTCTIALSKDMYFGHASREILGSPLSGWGTSMIKLQIGFFKLIGNDSNKQTSG